MKPFKLIENSKRVINNLTYKLKYSKNKVKDAKDINTLIQTLKSFDNMLIGKYRTDAIETLIYSLIYEYFMKYEAYNKEIPLNRVIYNIEKDISNGADHKKREVISILKHHEIKNKIENNSVFDKNYCNFDKMLTNLLNDFKKDIVWNLTK